MENLVFFKPLATRFKQITSVHYQAISHTDNQNLQYLPTSKMLSKITNKLITEVH